MFSAFLLMNVLKNNLSILLKNPRYILIAIITAVFLFAAYKVYAAISDVFTEISNNKVLVVEQAKKIQEQENRFKDQEKAILVMVQAIEQLRISNEQSQVIINELYQEQNKIKTKVQNRKVSVGKTITDIDKSKLTDNEKSIKRSEVLLDSLYGTHCELFGKDCK